MALAFLPAGVLAGRISGLAVWAAGDSAVTDGYNFGDMKEASITITPASYDALGHKLVDTYDVEITVQHLRNKLADFETLLILSRAPVQVVAQRAGDGSYYNFTNTRDSTSDAQGEALLGLVPEFVCDNENRHVSVTFSGRMTQAILENIIGAMGTADLVTDDGIGGVSPGGHDVTARLSAGAKSVTWNSLNLGVLESISASVKATGESMDQWNRNYCTKVEFAFEIVTKQTDTVSLAAIVGSEDEDQDMVINLWGGDSIQTTGGLGNLITELTQSEDASTVTARFEGSTILDADAMTPAYNLFTTSPDKLELKTSQRQTWV